MTCRQVGEARSVDQRMQLSQWRVELPSPCITHWWTRFVFLQTPIPCCRMSSVQIWKPLQSHSNRTARFCVIAPVYFRAPFTKDTESFSTLKCKQWNALAGIGRSWRGAANKQQQPESYKARAQTDRACWQKILQLEHFMNSAEMAVKGQK